MKPILLLQNPSWVEQLISLLATRALVVPLAAVVLAWALHLAAGRFRRWALQRLELETEKAGAGQTPTVRRLVIDWSAKALRTVVWLALLIFILNLLRESRSDRDKLLTILREANEFLVRTGIPAILIIVVTIFLMRFTSALIRTGFELFEQRITGEKAALVRRRTRTLSSISRGVMQAVIMFIGALVLLSQIGLSITPILASAGIVGIAVGFGAQSLVKDIFAGFLILLEEQYDVGDAVKIGDTTGTVERLTLRVTRIRSLDGALTTIPNGSITTVSNLSRDWSRAVLDVEIDYSADIDRAMQVMLATATQFRQERPDEITEEPSMLGVDKATGTGVTLRLTVKTAPAKQAEIARELRRRIKLAFDREGIRVPAGPPLLPGHEPATLPRHP
ncbi:MAG TPA: mechanosensitive ion channel family protein [Blastocatellia bacterium]|nr:mechanosensitive ion channel family protein [Blastocatellia bacterium]